MTRVVRRKSQEPEAKPLDVTYVAKARDQIRAAKKMGKKAQELESLYRPVLVEALEKYSYTDERGNRWVDLDDDGDRIKHERRVSKYFDSGEAEAWVRANGMWDDMKKVVEVLDEDKLAALAFTDKKFSKTVNSFYKERESWALVTEV